MYDEAGNRTTERGVYVSDYTRWLSSDETIATVDKNGYVTTYKEGEFTITAETYQSNANPGTNASVSVTLTAQPSIVSAVQKSATTAEVTFDTDMSSVVTKDNLIVSSIVGTTPVKQIVKSVSFDESGRVATVEVYVNFAANTEYTFAYNDMTAGFVGADLSIENVASIAIDTQTATVDELVPIVVKLYDENGIEILNDGSRVTIEPITDIFDGYIDGNSIYFWEVGEYAQVRAIFHTWEYSDTGVENTIEVTGTIVAVEELSGFGSIATYHIGESAPSDWNSVQHRIASDYTDRKIYVRAVDLSGEYMYNNPDDGRSEEFSFESSDPTTLIVDSDGVLYPVKAGNVDVIVYYEDTVVAALPVTVIAESTTINLSVELSGNRISAYPGAEDSITLTVTATDQLGESTIDGANDVEVDYLDGNETNVVPSQVENNRFVFETSNFADLDRNDFENGRRTYTYRYTVRVDNIVRTFSITVGYPTVDENTGLPVDIEYVITTPSEVDLAFNLADIEKGKNYDFATEFTIRAEGSNGYKIEDVSEIYSDEEEARSKVFPGTPSFYFKIDRPLDNSALSGAAIRLYNSPYFTGEALTGSAITKASTGNIRLSAYIVTATSEEDGTVTVNDERIVDNMYLRVTDSEATPAVTVLKNNIDNISDVVNDDVVRVLINGVNVAGREGLRLDVVIGETTDRPFVRSLAYDTTVMVNDMEFDYTFIIPVNQTFIVE